MPEKPWWKKNIFSKKNKKTEVEIAKSGAEEKTDAEVLESQIKEQFEYKTGMTKLLPRMVGFACCAVISIIPLKSENLDNSWRFSFSTLLLSPAIALLKNSLKTSREIQAKTAQEKFAEYVHLVFLSIKNLHIKTKPEQCLNPNYIKEIIESYPSYLRYEESPSYLTFVDYIIEKLEGPTALTEEELTKIKDNLINSRPSNPLVWLRYIP